MGGKQSSEPNQHAFSHYRSHLFDSTVEGYCLVFQKKTSYCEIEIAYVSDNIDNDDDDNKDNDNNNKHRYQTLRVKNDLNFQKKHGVDEYAKLLSIKNAENEPNKPWTAFMDDMFVNLRNSGIEYKIVNSLKYIFVLVSCSEKIVENFAELREMDIPIDPYRAVKEGNRLPKFLLAQRTILDANQEVCEQSNISITLWKDIHIGYENILHYRSNIYELCLTRNHSRNEGSVVSHILYLRILYEILVDDIELDGGNFIIQKYLKDRKHPLVEYFALNCIEYDIISSLNDYRIVRPVFSSSGINYSFLCKIRNYYGEQIAFYFAFLIHYTLWLYPLALIGFIWFCIELTTEGLATHGSTAFVLAVIVWATLMMSNWHKREWKLRFKWGMIRYRHTENPRPQFEGKYVVSSTSGLKVETYSSRWCHYIKMFISFLITFLCVLVVITVTVIIWSWQGYYRDLKVPDDTSFITSSHISIAVGLINSAQILIFNKLYTRLAIILNEWEGHRLEEDYYNNLVIKRISFIVINSFYSLFYIAFIDSREEYNNNSVRLEALRTQLVILFLMSILYQNSIEILLPILLPKIKKLCCGGGIDDDKTAIINKKSDDNHGDYGLTANDDDDSDNDDDSLPLPSHIIDDINIQINQIASPDVLDNTAEIIILHGYVTLFVIVFPLMPLLAVINLWVELSVDKYNLLHTQRPVPQAAAGIGVWSSVLSIFNIVSIFSNFALITFRTNLVIDLLIYAESFFKDIHQINWSNEDMQENLLVFFFIISLFLIFIIVGIKLCTNQMDDDTKDYIARQETCQRELVRIARNQRKDEITKQVLNDK